MQESPAPGCRNDWDPAWDAALARYAEDGFALLPGFRSAERLDALRQRALQIARNFVPAERASVFSTRDQARTADAQFLASADAIHCFFEEEAWDAQGRLRRPQTESINKIGHALHDLDPVFNAFSHGADLAAVAAALGLARPQLWQSMFIFKPPAIGGEVKWHQDASFLHTTPESTTGFWFALEDANRDNGCLWVQPGGHRGPLRERFVRDGDAVRMQALDATPWPDAASALPLEVPAGTLVCLHGRLPHCSGANRSMRSRHAYTLHAVDASSRWEATNWMRRGAALPLRGFLSVRTRTSA